MTEAKMMAGIPTLNAGLYRTIRFLVGDPAVYIELSDGSKKPTSTLILRDIEMERARKHARADHVVCPADFIPATGLSGDRETATAQAAAEFLVRHGIQRVTVDRSLPMIYCEMLRRAGVDAACDLEWGVLERRMKDEQELEFLRAVQATTEQVIEMACSTIANARADAQGILQHEGQSLTSERLQTMIDIWLLERNCTNPGSIVAGGPVGADCHHHGCGPLRSGEPIIVDVFPRCKKSLYNGDCTRTVVHGDIPEEVARMHAAVVAAKHAATQMVRANVSGDRVHQETIAAIENAGYSMGFPPEGAADSFCSMPHGTGHGLGLEVHEPPLLAVGGPELLAGDVVTIEPGLYCKAWGGVRVEDVVVVRQDGCENINRLHEGLRWG